MDKITLGEIGIAFAFLAGLIGSVATMHKYLKKWFVKSLGEQLKPIDKKLDDLTTRIDDVDKESCKNFLVRFLSDVEKGNAIDEIERERFFEEYQHYTKNGGNSYIKHKVDQLIKEGKL